MRYPALLVSGVDGDFALAAADDYAPVAAQADARGLTIFFASAGQRDDAQRALAVGLPQALVTPVDVDDEDWARRSQANLVPIVVERITVRPGDSDRAAETASHQRPGAVGPIDIVIEPSMGFGTGHHATTRLCLAGLQRLERSGRLAGLTLLDVGTGSGVLALAARALGATSALGVDYDPDAIASAVHNLPLNPNLDAVEFRVRDITREALPVADVVTANLTGTLLCRVAPQLTAAVAAGGALVVSGILQTERDAVAAAFTMLRAEWASQEDEWVALGFHHSTTGSV